MDFMSKDINVLWGLTLGNVKVTRTQIMKNSKEGKTTKMYNNTYEQNTLQYTLQYNEVE